MVKSELLNYWEDGKPVAGYRVEEESIVKDPLNNVEDSLFAFILSLLY